MERPTRAAAGSPGGTEVRDGGPGRIGIAVFGSSEPSEADPLYVTAREVGRLLALSGFVVVNGGYGGVMEAASRGAHDAGGESLGITVRALTERRAGPNRFLTRHRESEGLFERTRELIEESAGYIILAGKSGTLAELTFLWALHRAQMLGNRPVVLLGDFWGRFLALLRELDLVDEGQISITHVTTTAQDAVNTIRKSLMSTAK